MECEIIVDNSLVICLKEHIYDKTVADRNSIYRNAAAVPLLAVMIQTKRSERTEPITATNIIHTYYA